MEVVTYYSTPERQHGMKKVWWLRRYARSYILELGSFLKYTEKRVSLSLLPPLPPVPRSSPLIVNELGKNGHGVQGIFEWAGGLLRVREHWDVIMSGWIASACYVRYDCPHYNGRSCSICSVWLTNSIASKSLWNAADIARQRLIFFLIPRIYARRMHR